MEGSGGGGGGGSGGPAPFLLKTYEMVDDMSTDEIVSWSPGKASFVVWNPEEFARVLLPTYFKHNNFSSFIRQLNTYWIWILIFVHDCMILSLMKMHIGQGFRKIDSERWEFANEEFIKDQKHLLKNIHRRKPIHSHSHPVGSGDAERAALEEEIEKLNKERSSLQADLRQFKLQQPATRIQLEDVDLRVKQMEQRQARMMEFLAKAVKNPLFVKNLVQMSETTVDLSGNNNNRKRRLPGIGCSQEVLDGGFVDNHSSSSKSPEFCPTFHRDFFDKLKLELSPALSDGNRVSGSTHSTNEEEGSALQSSERVPKDIHERAEVLSFAPDALDLSDTGTSYLSRTNILLPMPAQRNENLELQDFLHSHASEEGEGLIACHLNLTLASTALQVDSSLFPARVPQSSGQESGSSADLNNGATGKDSEKNKSIDAGGLGQEASTNNQGPSAPPARVNDVFWEQFLTERPGCSDTEEASSSLRTYDDQNVRKIENDKSWRSRQDMQQLSL
ncbi:Heat stress transcription factor A-5 [Acorus gramineus]|uniref:Heat stress transcription factor A-5 n=1 Tax=Acorus gramineus TaxID=55184 RepID=A0AAV9A5S0_ACOGR|nr:Heat stress transcription factor A-5 [Acorus gramineus]